MNGGHAAIRVPTPCKFVIYGVWKMEQRKRRRKKRGCLGCLGVVLQAVAVLVLTCVIVSVALPGVMELLPDLPRDLKKAVSESRVPFEELAVVEEDVTAGYYYQNLNDEERQIYKEILQGVQKREETIYVHTGDFELLKKVYHFLVFDRPELFWCTGGLEATYYPTYSELSVEYNCTEEERLIKRQQIDAEAEMALNLLLVQHSAERFDQVPEYERVKFVFEYLVNTVDYVEGAPDNQNIYSALVGKRTVCAGYARSAQYLLQKMGMECIYVTGTCANGEAHAWNLVKCEGNWYQMDVTFGDPEYMQTEEGEALESSEIDYGYLCCNDEQMLKERVADDLVPFPPCTSLDYNYYVMRGRYYAGYNAGRVLEDMKQDIYNGEKKFVCQFASGELCSQAFADMEANLFQEAAQTFMTVYGLQNVEYYYLEDQSTNTVKVYWNE